MSSLQIVRRVPACIVQTAVSRSSSVTHAPVEADFIFSPLVYADWCGPCKAIAPHFEKMSQEYSKPKKVAFCKVNVDSQSSISRAHGVSAMPTFMIFHAGQAIETIRGANPPALAAAVTKAIALPEKANSGGSFKTPGRTLGAESGGGQAATRGGGAGIGFDVSGIFRHIIAVLGLYLVSLFAVRWFMFGLPPGGFSAMLTDWLPTSLDRLLHPSATVAFQHGQPAATDT